MNRRIVIFVNVLVVCAVLGLVSAGPAAAGGAPAGPRVPAKWTVAIYANGDNDLM